MQEEATHARRGQRSRAVSFVASLLLLEALLVALAGIAAGVVEVSAVPVSDLGPEDAFGPIVSLLPNLGVAAIIVVAGGGLALAGIGLLQMREWGWVLAMAIQGLGLANALYAHVSGAPQYIPLALCSFVVLVLNQREVRQAFQVHAEHA